MGIISKHTATRLWTAHHQIDTANKLLADIEETLQEGGDPTPQDPYNRHRRGYTLGVPHGSGERVLGVHPRLAHEVIMAHRTEQFRMLDKASRDAWAELAVVDKEFAEVEPPAPELLAPVEPRHPDGPPEDLPF